MPVPVFFVSPKPPKDPHGQAPRSVRGSSGNAGDNAAYIRLLPG
jgi:hypothetical protein